MAKSSSKGIGSKIASAVSKAASKVASTVAKATASKSSKSSTPSSSKSTTSSTSKTSGLIGKNSVAATKAAATAAKAANQAAAKSAKTATTSSTKSSSSGTKSAVTGGGSVAGMAAKPSTKSVSSGGSYYYTPSTSKGGSYSSPSSAVQASSGGSKSGGGTTSTTSVTNGKKVAGSRNTSKQETTTTFDDLTGEVVGIANTDLGTSNTKSKEEKDAEIAGTNKDESEGFNELTGEIDTKTGKVSGDDDPFTDPVSGKTFDTYDDYRTRWQGQAYAEAYKADKKEREREARKAAKAAEAAQINSEAAKPSAPTAFNQFGQHHAQGPIANSKTNERTNTYQDTMSALERLGLKSNAATMGTPLSPTVTAGEQNGYNNANSLIDTYMKKFDTLEQGGTAGDVASNAAYTYTDFLKQLNNYRNVNGMGEDEYNNLLNKIQKHPIWRTLSGNRR